MADNDIKQGEALSDTAKDAVQKASAAARDVGGQVSSAAQDYGDKAKSAVKTYGEQAAAKVGDVQDNAKSIADDLKARAGQHANEAKNVVSDIANEARNKVSEIVDQQKSMGADKLSGISRAVHSAASDLEEQNPQVARLVHDAAATVDGFAGNLRDRSLGDVVASVSDFARKQPVAFFAASVLAGFVLARFVKSEPIPVEPGYESRRSTTARR